MFTSEKECNQPVLQMEISFLQGVADSIETALRTPKQQDVEIMRRQSVKLEDVKC
jgi:hypothetical protein